MYKMYSKVTKKFGIMQGEWGFTTPLLSASCANWRHPSCPGGV